jgi:predicted metal-binding membrane protein
MPHAESFEAALRRDRLIVLLGLCAVTVLSWVYTVYLVWGMKGMEAAMAMPELQPWAVADLILLFIMWAVMMVAMMVPSAFPLVLIFAGINRRRRVQQDPLVPTGVFLLGYLLAWTVYSVLATSVQWGLHTAALLSPMMVSTSPVLGAAILVGAGIFQWTPLKYTCMVRCRSPRAFILTEWREGAWGSLVMGFKSGIYCVVCCWLLMSILFVTGVMNLLWMAVITVFVLLEKVIPRGEWFGRAAGLLLMGWGTWMAAEALL